MYVIPNVGLGLLVISFLLSFPLRSARFFSGSLATRMEAEVVGSEMVLPAALPFKRVQMSDKYPKGQSRGRHWKHLKQILQAENYASLPAHEPNC